MRRILVPMFGGAMLVALAACAPTVQNPGGGDIVVITPQPSATGTPTSPATPSTGGPSEGGPTTRPTATDEPPAGTNHAVYAMVTLPEDVRPAYTSNPYGVVLASRTGTGRWTVTFRGAGVVGNHGIAHAQAYFDDSGKYCNVWGWGTIGSNVFVNVRCYAANGSAVDAGFLVNWAAGPVQSRASFAYLMADQANAGAGYQPQPAYAYDNVGTTTVYPGGPGEYTAVLPSVGQGGGGIPIVTAVNSNKRCKVDSVTPGAHEVSVACYAPDGTRANSEFALTVTRTGPLGPSLTNVTFDEDTAGSSATGLYTARFSFPGTGDVYGHVWVQAEGPGSTYCTPRSWARKPDGALEIGVACFNSSGSPANTFFTGAYMLAA
jgi:hypothetical protein